MKELTFREFVQLCKDADHLLDDLTPGAPQLQRKQPNNLKAAAIHYLARKRRLHITICNLYQIYGIPQPALNRIKHLIKEVCDVHDYCESS